MDRLSVRGLALVVVWLVCGGGAATAVEAKGDVPEKAVAIGEKWEGIFRVQQEAWNRGDIDAFMEHYWKSDDLTFSSGGKTTRGWRATARSLSRALPVAGKNGPPHAERFRDDATR